MALRSFIFSLAILITFFSESKGQTILNGDSTSFTTKYCRDDINYQIIGQPAGGVFSGCGVFQQGGNWYLNPLIASQNIAVYPYQCLINYTVNNITANYPIIINKPLVFTPPLKDTATCNGNFSLATSLYYAGDYDYTWTPGIYLKDPDSISTTGYITQTQTFILTATDRSTGCSGNDTVVVTRNPTPKLTITKDTSAFPRTGTQLSVTGAVSYIWSPNQWLDNPFSADPVATPHESITYSVTGTNEYGCSATAAVHINIMDGMFFPNAFSPNGDGLNDVFRIGNFGYDVVQEFRIFDRWGKELFFTRDGTKGWDGNVNGTPAEAGSYFFHIMIGMRDGTQRLIKGDVTLVR